MWRPARAAYLALMIRNIWIGAAIALVAVVVFNVLGILGHDLALWESILIVVGVGVVFGLVAALLRYVVSKAKDNGESDTGSY